MNTQTADKGRWWKLALGPWMAVVTWLAYRWAQPLQMFQEPEGARIIFWHVPMAWLGLLWFFVGAWHGARYLWGGTAGDPRRDLKSVASCEMGLVCTVLATVTGMVFAQLQWGVPWNWDPKQVSITILILIFAAYFVFRASIDGEDRRARLSAAYAIFGAAATPFLMFVIPQLPAVKSLHPPGDTITGGLDSKWRTIYTMSFVGFLSITCWVVQLRVRLALIQERLESAALDTSVRTEAVRQTARLNGHAPSRGAARGVGDLHGAGQEE